MIFVDGANSRIEGLTSVSYKRPCLKELGLRGTTLVTFEYTDCIEGARLEGREA